MEEPRDVTRADAELDVEDRDDRDAPSDSPGAPPTWLSRGQSIGRYVIVECLGVGGMGIVYSAWDPKLDRKLAIKLVRVKQGASGATRGRNRLLREAQALARVRHPNVITVHDVGSHEGRVFVAMEFVEGITLQQWLERRPNRPFRELLDVFLQAGRGLAAAHRAGLVHRDFKPENVMIGNDGRVLVLDFGIARGGPTTGVVEPSDAREHDTDVEELGPSERIEDGMTRQGAVVGTPGYMSPEQRRSRPLDGRSDQFSFCVALWEALAGERPFGEGPPHKLLARIRLGQIRPMRRKDVPRRLIAALRRGLAWSRNDRFATMEGLLEALNPRGRPRSRLPLVLSASAAVVAFACAVVVGIHHFEDPTPPTPSCAIDRARLDALWSEDRASRIAAALQSRGDVGGSTWIRARERIEGWTHRWLTLRAQTCRAHLEHELSDELHDLRVACLDRQLDRFARVLDELGASTRGSNDPVIELIAGLPEPERCSDDEALRARSAEPDSTSARARLAELRREADALEIQLELAEYDAGVEPARQLLAAARELDYLPMRARAGLILGNFLERIGAAQEAEQVLLDALRTAAAAGELELEAEAIHVLAGLLSTRGLHDEALRWLELGEGLAIPIVDSLHLQVSFANTRAAIAYRRGDLAGAEAGFEQARALLETQTSLDDDLQLPLVLQNLAVVIDRRGEPERALALHRRALAMFERQLGPGHPRVALVRSNLASALLETGDREAAQREYARALALLEASVGPGLETAVVRGHLAAIHESFGRCSQARALLDAALVEIEAAAPEGLEHAGLLASRARVCNYADPEALAWIDRAAAIHERLEDGPHVERVDDRIDRALALLARDRPREALEQLDAATAFVGELPRAGVARLDAARGLVLLALGRRDDAELALARARPDLPLHSPLARRCAAALDERRQP